MATDIQTIDITKQNIYGNCDLKCSYNYKYSESNSVATNKGVYISLSYDKGTTAPVTYNNQNYYVSNIMLTNKSLHMFDGNFVDSELIVEHSPELGGDNLFVCIPIISSTNNSDASNFLSEIIDSVSKNAPTQGESSNLNISNFNLNNFIPKKPFYAYTGTMGLTGQVVVYDLNYAIALNDKVLKKITKIIQPYPISLRGGNLFFNKIGPNNIQLENGIYISCQPTGSSTEEVDVMNVNNNISSTFDSSDMTNIFYILLSFVVFIVLFGIISFIYNRLTSPPVKLSQNTR